LIVFSQLSNECSWEETKMTNTKDTGKLIDSHEKEKTQFYRGYL